MRYFKMENLRPGNSSQAGFLNRTESFHDVLDEDNTTLKKLNITHEQIADALETVIGMTRRAVTIQDRDYVNDIWVTIKKGLDIKFNNEILKITFKSYRGYQYCPFCTEKINFNCSLGMDFTKVDDQFIKSDTDFTISRNNESIFVSNLHVHLIRHHHFFEGHTNYRLDPVKVIKILALQFKRTSK